MELELTTFDMPLAIENARTFVRERATRHGIKLDVMIDERLGDYFGDERKIKQILLNLLSNAVKFTPEGGQIRINARQLTGQCKSRSAIPASASLLRIRQGSSRSFAKWEATTRIKVKGRGSD